MGDGEPAIPERVRRYLDAAPPSRFPVFQDVELGETGARSAYLNLSISEKGWENIRGVFDLARKCAGKQDDVRLVSSSYQDGKGERHFTVSVIYGEDQRERAYKLLLDSAESVTRFLGT